MPPARRRRIGLPQHPSVGIRVAYRKRLDRLIDCMANSLDYWICARWKANPPVLAMDEAPSRAMIRSMKELSRRWTKRFGEDATKIATWFARQVMRHSTQAMEKTLEAGRVPTVEFKMTAGARDAFNAIVGENVALIKSIAASHLTAVQGSVMRLVALGRDLGTLAKELQEQHGVTKRRAALISRDQSNKASAVITRVRQCEAGITHAIWEHSHAGKTPRKEHVAFSGKTYEVTRGAYLEKKWVWPGTEINCRCFSRPLLEGFK